MSSKGKEAPPKNSAVVSKNVSPAASKASTHTVTPLSSSVKGNRAKPTAEKQRLEEEAAARVGKNVSSAFKIPERFSCLRSPDKRNNFQEHQKQLRTTPNEFGLTLDDYSDILTCPATELSGLCSRIFKYAFQHNDYKSTMLEHFYVRSVHDLREFARDETSIKLLVDAFLVITEKLKESNLPPDVVDVLGRTYSSLMSSEAPLTQPQVDNAMAFYTKSLIYNQALIREAFTCERLPTFVTERFKIRLPPEGLSAAAAVFPLAEAIPKSDVKSPGLVSVAEAPEKPAAENAGSATTDQEQNLSLPTSQLQHPQGLEATAGAPQLTETEINAAVEKVIKAKSQGFQEEVQSAIRSREQFFNDHLSKRTKQDFKLKIS